jgi:hypothetical protein
MAITNEDRNEAIRKVAEAIQGAAHGRAAARKAKLAVEALTDLGWGPRPRVSGDDLDNVADGYAHSVPGVPDVIRLGDLAAVLRECGIEVTDEA